MNNQKPAQIPKIQLNEAQIPNNMENQTIHPNNFKNQQNVINEAHKPNLIGRKTDQNRTSNDNQNQAINMKQNNQPQKTEPKKMEENQIEKIYIPQNVPSKVYLIQKRLILLVIMKIVIIKIFFA